jgi:serine/threonine protein kinase
MNKFAEAIRQGSRWGLSKMKSPQSRYEFIGTLGTGATSRVDKARDSTIGRTVAIKTFLHGFGSGDIQKQFLREAQIVGRLTHPYIVGLYDIGTNEDGVPYLVMEYVEGKTLEKTLDNGPLPLERAAVWGADLASALSRAHQCKIIHGDVKPANILITSDGQVKLGDFGVARFATQVSGSGSILGTPAYLSPEQILGGKQDTRSDLFSLGIILYQMTTGVRPFDGTSVGAVCAQIVSATPLPPSHHNPELPAAFDHIVMRCLAKDPALRYADGESLCASLYPFARSKPVPAPRPIESWWKRSLEVRDLRVAAVALLGLAALVAGIKTVRQFSARNAVPVAANAWPVGPDVLQRNAMAANQASPTSELSAAPSASLINVGAADLRVSNGRSSSEDSSPLGSGGAFNHEPGPEGATRPNDLPPKNATPAAASAAHALGRHAAVATPPKGQRPLASSDASAATLTVSPATSPTAKGSTPSVTKTPLHVDIVSGVADEVLSIYSGDELLLTTQLQAAHLGDTMRFDCPITPGEHAFRVVLSRTDETVLVEKSSTSLIRAEGSNFLGVHVTRRAKMLVKHESSLEVVWPSTTAPIATAVSARAESGMALR